MYYFLSIYELAGSFYCLSCWGTFLCLQSDYGWKSCMAQDELTHMSGCWCSLKESLLSSTWLLSSFSRWDWLLNIMMASGQSSKKRSQKIQMLVKPLFVSHLLMSHRPNQITRPNPVTMRGVVNNLCPFLIHHKWFEGSWRQSWWYLRGNEMQEIGRGKIKDDSAEE